MLGANLYGVSCCCGLPTALLIYQLSAAVVQVAFQQADYVAWNVWSAINGRPLLPFKYQHLGDMMSLGEAALPLLRGAGTMLPLAA